MEASYTAEFDAEEQGVLSAQQPHLHTGGAPKHNITHTIEHIKHEISSPDKIELSTNSMRLAGKASVPAGGPFVVVLTGEPLIFSPLVHMTSVPDGGLFV